MPGAPLPVLHTRSTEFSYECRGCSRCCYNRRIQVNPYELARLARGLGITTTEVIARFTVEGGTALATRAERACVFLGERGCTVHTDRPLVCRLYPLGRVVKADGSESFVENEPHPETRGLYGRDGTVEGYIESQGVGPYIAAANRYYAVFTRLVNGTSEAPSADSVVDILPRAFIDADLAVMWASGGNSTAQLNVDALIDEHLALIHQWAKELCGTVAAPLTPR